MNDGNFWIALGLTTFAGLSTGIGSAIAFFVKRTNYRFLSWATGFSAGVMLYVSFVEILAKSSESLTATQGEEMARLLMPLSFFGGIALIFLIDRLVPAVENPHEIRSEAELEKVGPETSPKSEGGPSMPGNKNLHRTGIFCALAIGIHNFPEGLVTFLAAYQDPALGMAIAVAIALHNIPEGISVSVPIYYATGSRKRAFSWSLVSGLAEPAGALAGFFLLRTFLNGEMMGILFGVVAGIMVYISLDELLPISRAYGKGHDSLYGLLAGMLIMAATLVVLD